MTWNEHVRRGLWLLAALAIGCGPTQDAPGESESSGGSGPMTTAGDASTSEPSPLDGSSSGDASSTGAPSLPCAWVESTYEAELPMQPVSSNATCDPATSTATLRLTFDDGLDCGSFVGSDHLIIELPPELQAAGEYDLTTLTAIVELSADLSPVHGQVDVGTLIITEVTPTSVVGWAHGGRDGYDFLGSFEASYCP